MGIQITVFQGPQARKVERQPVFARLSGVGETFFRDGVERGT